MEVTAGVCCVSRYAITRAYGSHGPRGICGAREAFVLGFLFVCSYQYRTVFLLVISSVVREIDAEPWAVFHPFL